MRLLVIDGNSIANRAFFGIKLLTTKDGRYTNAIYGFLNILLSLLKECEPDEVAVAFDLKAPTFRHKMYDGYKATRHGMPDDLAQQMPVLKELLAELGFVMVSREGWEADDLLGTLSAAAATRGDECLLATGDRDSLQLVNEMLVRGYEFLPIELGKSRGSKYVVGDGKVRLPFSSLKGLGGAAADALERVTIHGEEYLSVEELQQASGVGQGILDRLRQVGALGDLPESSQVSFF